MKKYKFLSLLLTLMLLFNAVVPVAQAADLNNPARAQMSEELTFEEYSIRGIDNTQARFNIFINNEEETAQFAIIYHDSSDYLYEFVFDLVDVPRRSTNTSTLWEDVRAYCFASESLWTETYLPTAVTVTQEAEANTFQRAATPTRSAETDYFENWLTDLYGSEYSGSFITSKTQSGVTMYLKSGFQAYAYKDYTYLLNQTFTVTGFVTAILGFSSTHPIIGVLGVIAGTGGLFSLKQSVYQYKVRANWFKYATCVSGTGYPYGLTDKFTFYNGYSYSGTGTCNVDSASASTSYVPSSTVYNSNTNIFNAAFDEYQRIGFQNGNF